MENSKHEDFYRRLRAKVTDFLGTERGAKHPWREYLLLAPDLFYLLTQLVRDKRVPKSQKLKLGAAIAYFLSPIELFPEFVLGPIGLVDDIAFAAFALNSVLNEIDPAIVREHWTGEEDILQVVQRILARANRYLGSGVWGKVLGRFGFRRAA